jgi:hypothetical protein
LIEIGSKHKTEMARKMFPQTLTQAASITINESTPAFTALPIFGPIGFEMALSKGLNIK